MTDFETIRVLVVDDQELVRTGFTMILGGEDDIEVVGDADDGDVGVQRVNELEPDVVLMDVQMPRLDGISATRQIVAEHPGTKVLILTTFDDDDYLFSALDAGASGFVVKDTPAEQLADAVRRVHRGLRVVDPDLAVESLAIGTSPLTERERDVLVHASGGGTVADIARETYLSEGTVRNYLSSAMGKTGGRTRAEAVRIAEDNGWLLGR